MRSSTQFRRMITAIFVMGFLAGVFSMRAFSWNAPDEANVNSRYTVESVELSGAEEARLSKTLREELRGYVGKPFSPEAFGKLSARVRQELKARLVSPKLVKGSSPENVRVVLDVMGQHIILDTQKSRFAWHPKLGWTGDLVLNLHEGRRQTLMAGVFSDADTFVERSAGLQAGYRFSLFSGRVRPGILFSTSHAQYDARTLAGAGPEDLYRNVDSFQPTVVLVPFRGADGHELSLESGLRLQRFVLDSPGPDRNVASHALVNTLRYQRVRGDVSTGRTVAKVSYGLTNATGLLSSAYRFQRQEARGELVYQRGPSTLSFDFTGGTLNGRAPIRDRFTAGTTRVLRGWNKWELAPLGASRLVATSTEYSYSLRRKLELAAFFDSGSVWNRNATAPVRNSAGVGLRTREGFYLYVAFPMREGRAEAVLMTGASF